MPPTARELVSWARVAQAHAVHGRWRRESASGSAELGGWFGAAPVAVDLPASGEVEFWYQAPDRWRLEHNGSLLAVTDGHRAWARSPDGVLVGGELLMPGGPQELLEPQVLEHRRLSGLTFGEDDQDVGVVVGRDDLLGREAWMLRTGEAVWWLDEQTGCALRRQTGHDLLELTAFDTDVELDELLFSVPAASPAGEESSGEEQGWAGLVQWQERARQRHLAPQADFTVAWWPYGTEALPIEGDPSLPDVLLDLTVGRDTPQIYLGVAPAGQQPRTHRGCQVRTWTSPSWAFALSWHGDLTDGNLAEIIASVPAEWA